MEFLDSLLISVLGIAIVFAVLVALILMINLLKVFSRQISKSKAGGSDLGKDGQETTPAMPAPSVGSQALSLVDVDEKTAAMIMAIVCHETGTPPDQLYFKSIRRIQDGAPAQNEGV